MEDDGSKQAQKDLNKSYNKLGQYIDQLDIPSKQKRELGKLIYNVGEGIIDVESYCGD